ncbi:helix-turn-helix domain-containing protein [Microbispora sp. NPDC049125]|uniref:helix-turn-helix domain-containing protein n=1 Tax=Microbispora sp. NPDC049125 TaxID=3154929 RepID=UPI003465B80D
MTGSHARVGVGTRFHYDGEVVEVVSMLPTTAGNEVLLRDGRGRMLRLALRELMVSERARVIPDGPGLAADDIDEPASVVFGQLTEAGRQRALETAAHVREMLTGYRSGSAELAAEGEPRQQYLPHLPLTERYAAKAAELGVGYRTVERWAAAFRDHGEAGLADNRRSTDGPHGRADPRWVEAALEIMVEHTEESKPSRTMVIRRTEARLETRYGKGEVKPPSRAAAFRLLGELEKRQPTFRLSTKRNRDIADRPGGVYGKLRPTRPGEYILMDTTRLDVFALDPVTLRWLQAELTVAMDWYTRCIVGIRVTPVSTKSIDASSVLYQVYRPRPAGRNWPAHAVWPEHGIPRAVLLDVEAIEGPVAQAAGEIRGAAGPALVPETIVVDHGKIYVSEHLASVCQRLGISIQPARLRTGRDKGPVERFFRTVREDLLQALPGYKGPDVHSRGVNPEADAYFFLDELEAIIREWIAVSYHHRPHDSLVDPHVPGLRMSPAMMFEHGIARAGYIEVPRDPDLAFEFLQVKWRTIQHYGVEIGGRYNGAGLNPYRGQDSPYTGPHRGKWPIYVDPDDIAKVYFRDPDQRWHVLNWEHAPALDMPLSEEALRFARKLAAAKYTYPDDKIAVADLLERWRIGLGTSVAERRLALRISRDQAAIDLPAGGQDAVEQLPSVRRVLDAAAVAEVDEERADEGPGPQSGDDDDEDELDFYTEALEDL